MRPDVPGLSLASHLRLIRACTGETTNLTHLTKLPDYIISLCVFLLRVQCNYHSLLMSYDFLFTTAVQSVIAKVFTSERENPQRVDKLPNYLPD